MWKGTCAGREDEREELEEIGGEIQKGAVYTCIRLNC